MRQSSVRDDRQRGSARCQMQEVSTVGKFHGVPSVSGSSYQELASRLLQLLTTGLVLWHIATKSNAALASILCPVLEPLRT